MTNAGTSFRMLNMTTTHTYRVYAPGIGRPGTPMYTPRRDFGTVTAESDMRALDIVADRIGAIHIARHQTIAVMGVGSIAVERIDS